MTEKEKLTRKQALSNEYEEKTATNNQWASVTDVNGVQANAEKTATDNQWVSTNKNKKS